MEEFGYEDDPAEIAEKAGERMKRTSTRDPMISNRSSDLLLSTPNLEVEYQSVNGQYSLVAFNLEVDNVEAAKDHYSNLVKAVKDQPEEAVQHKVRFKQNGDFPNLHLTYGENYEDEFLNGELPGLDPSRALESIENPYELNVVEEDFQKIFNELEGVDVSGQAEESIKALKDLRRSYQRRKNLQSIIDEYIPFNFDVEKNSIRATGELQNALPRWRVEGLEDVDLIYSLDKLNEEFSGIESKVTNNKHDTVHLEIGGENSDYTVAATPYGTKFCLTESVSKQLENLWKEEAKGEKIKVKRLDQRIQDTFISDTISNTESENF